MFPLLGRFSRAEIGWQAFSLLRISKSCISEVSCTVRGPTKPGMMDTSPAARNAALGWFCEIRMGLGGKIILVISEHLAIVKISRTKWLSEVAMIGSATRNKLSPS